MKIIILSFMTMFLVFSAYSQENAQEYHDFKNGKYKKYKCSGEGKGDGLKFLVKYPETWTSEEADRPHIVRKFMGELMGLMIYVDKINGPVPSNDVIDDAFNLENLKIITGINDFISYDLSQSIDGIRTACAYFYYIDKRLDLEIKTKNLMYVLIYKNYIIQLHFSLSVDLVFSAFLDYRFKRFEDLFKLIANSFVVTSKWE